MKLPAHSSARTKGSPFATKAGFSLVEVMVGSGVLGFMIVAFYAGIEFGIREIRLARENVRATQILEEKMELIRLYNWNQVNLPGYIPTTFTAPFYASNPTNPPSNNFTYTGSVLVTGAPLTETYSTDLRMIQIQVRWTSGNVLRKRQMSTFVSQYGLQKYVY